MHLRALAAHVGVRPSPTRVRRRWHHEPERSAGPLH
jgi:hypothetical protein